MYPDCYTHVVSHSDQAGAAAAAGKSTPTTTRRRRRKNKGGEGGVGGGARKRKLSEDQVSFLEVSFRSEPKLESERKDRLALELGLDPRQVAVWFQNRRARWKNKKLEDEYSKLKAAHATVAREKCHLEAQVIKLEERLSEAVKEIQRLSDRGDNSCSSSSVLSMEAMDAHLFGEGLVNMFYEGNCVPSTDWVYDPLGNSIN